MSLHDAYARVTPVEIAFPDADALDDLVKDVMEEASARKVDPELPGVFTTLGSVDDFVREVLAPDAPGSAVGQYGALVFQVVHFARAGRPLYLLDVPGTRRLLEAAPAADPRPPAVAGYLQLPQHLFWMGGPDGGAPESVDGLFWFVSRQDVGHVLPITGLMPDGPGFRALPLPEAPFDEAVQWLDADMRGSTDDYSSSLPGHDLDQLYSVETAGEVLKLLARFFSYLGSRPDAPWVVTTPIGASPGGAPSDGPRASVLPYTRVELLA